MPLLLLLSTASAWHVRPALVHWHARPALLHLFRMTISAMSATEEPDNNGKPPNCEYPRARTAGRWRRVHNFHSAATMSHALAV